MRNRITYILAALILVIGTFAALARPVHAQSEPLDPPGTQSGGNSGSFGSPGSTNSSPLNPPTSGANAGTDVFNTQTTNLGSSNPGFGTPLNPPAASGANTVTNPYSTTPASGNVSSSGAANSGQTPSSLEACSSIFHPLNCMNELLAGLANSVLDLTATLVTISGSILSFSIVLTLHIKDFVDATPAIFSVWTTLRDVTSLFFIFFLLWAAFKIILGMDSKIGELVKNLVLAGILINFSFFFVGIMIDASNIVSQALYNAMVPASISDTAAQHIRQGDINSMLTDVTGMTNNLQNPDNTKYGIATIFVNALQLSEVKGVNPSTDVMTSPMKIFFIAVVGIMIMITAALSFIAAAAAFIVRLVILIFLLAVSPLWFASWIIPNIKKEFNFLGKLMPQLIFMPLYLLLMYVGLKVIAGSNMLRAASATIPGASGAANWIFSYIILSINFAIVIIILNLPLFVALTMSGNFGKTKWLEKFDAGTIWKKFGSQAGSRTLGRAAYSLNQQVTPRLAAFSPLAGSLSNSALSKVSKAGFGEKKGGYEDRLKAKKKSHEDLHKKIGEMVEERGGTKDDAKKYQAAYRKNLEWKAGGVGGLNFGRGSGVIGFMVDNRANKQSTKKLDKISEKQQKKEAKKDSQKKKTTLIKEKEELIKENENPSLILPGRLAEETRGNRNKRIKEIDAEIQELDEKIVEGREVEEEERDEKFMSKFDDVAKKEDVKKD